MGTTKPQTNRQNNLQQARGKDGSNQHFRKRKPKGVDELPGVQKIKSSIRQTKRLLAKDNLDADVRVTTERRLKSLENDLAKAELARTEKTMAARYHKVKLSPFRRNVYQGTDTSQISRSSSLIKRLLETPLDADGEKLGKKEKKALEKELVEKRIDLNYITAKKYISLYPNSTEDGSDDGKNSAEEVPNGVNSTAETDQQRQGLRDAVKAAMESGEMSGEPELYLSDMHKITSIPVQTSTRISEHSVGPSEGTKKSKRKKGTVIEVLNTTEMDTSIANDEFFDI
ncbi:12003_t:CDS:2 [Acaulospora colombiana]|uniref:12003_t:CDS:1 n=1 Tax=Acaulospora colombiana TaxID=27376 RepID=A0ACA9LPH8_9GLOM|nr:12003_t:CDS:2 [Acaulospora colombiana]